MLDEATGLLEDDDEDAGLKDSGLDRAGMSLVAGAEVTSEEDIVELSAVDTSEEDDVVKKDVLEDENAEDTEKDEELVLTMLLLSGSPTFSFFAVQPERTAVDNTKAIKNEPLIFCS